MIETVKKEKDTYLANFAETEEESAQTSPAWLHRLRKDAILRFSELGFPTTREEEWKFTNVAPLARVPFRLPRKESEGAIRLKLQNLPFSDLGAPRVIFVNGSYAPALSSTEELPKEIEIKSLAAALATHSDLIEEHLGRYARMEEHAFNALNTAFVRDGAFVRLPKGVVVEKPIHLLFLSTAQDEPTVSHPRNLIVAEANSQATIVEHYVGSGKTVYFTNPVTELAAGENAMIDHYNLQTESREAFHVATLQLEQGRSSSVTTHSIALGGSLVRNHLNAVLDGEGADCLLNGLYLLAGRQHLDNHTGIEHAQPRCTSRELYKGILDEKSRGVFHGRILVRRGAQKTDSKQTNKNLLLSDQALVNSKPQLEIYADDVKCTHGATIGQLDKDALFYLRSRGIDRSSARSLLIYAFASEIVGRVKVAALREQLDKFVFNWLPKGELSRESLRG